MTMARRKNVRLAEEKPVNISLERMNALLLSNRGAPTVSFSLSQGALGRDQNANFVDRQSLRPGGPSATPA